MEKIIERSSADMYKEDQCKYAIIVDRRRALPEIRDGLKPVQRRILYGAFTQNMIGEKRKEKTSSLAGELMKNYHPHGCLDALTKLYSTDGRFYNIGDLYSNKIKTLDILALDETGKVVKAVATDFRIGQYADKIYSIRLTNGYTINCTGNHPFLTPNGWIHAEDLKINTRFLLNNITLCKEDNDLYFINYKDEYDILDSIIDSKLPIAYDTYKELYVKEFKQTPCSEEEFNIILKEYKDYRPYIKSIVISNYPNAIPMYDFTVQGYENLITPLNPEYSREIKNTPFIAIHNSSSAAIATMVAWFKSKYPLMWGKGNWGSVTGDGPAADRYTECALSQFGYDVMIDELRESPNVVNWLDTYKRNGMKEPEYLPTKAPILLINGTSGIGVGLAVDIPPHNLGEVIDATIALLRKPSSNVVLIPDMCQPCDIIDTDWRSISNNGSGSFKVRGRIVTERDKKGNCTLRVVSLPDTVTTNGIYEKILKMIEDKQITMISDILNSTKDQMPNIIIHLKSGVDAEYVKQFLYAKTEIQKVMRVNFEAVAMNGIDVERFSYKKYLLSFIEQRMMVKFRLYCNILQKASTRHHYLDAFIKVLESGQIDKIINMIKKSKGDEKAIIEWIIKHCGTDEIQANYIIQTKLANLSMRNLAKYKAERKELEGKIKAWTTVVTDDGTMIRKEIENELLDIKKKYNTPRLCRIISEAEGNNIPAGTFKIVITEKNCVRKIPDIDKINIIKKDNPKFILRVDNTENLLIFDTMGKVFNLPIHKIPVTDKQSAGIDIRILIKNLTSDIVSVFYEPMIKQISKSGAKHHFVVLSTANVIKRLDLEDFLNVSTSGLVYTKLKESDYVRSVYLAPDTLDAVICSDSKALRCRVKDIPVLKRAALGVKAMDTNEPIEGLTIIYPDSSYIVVVTANGKMNRFDIGLLRTMSRAKKGSNVIKLEGGDKIFGIYAVNDKDKIHVITTEGVLDINVSDIKITSNIAKGIKLVPNKSVIVKVDVVR